MREISAIPGEGWVGKEGRGAFGGGPKGGGGRVSGEGGGGGTPFFSLPSFLLTNLRPTRTCWLLKGRNCTVVEPFCVIAEEGLAIRGSCGHGHPLLWL